MVTEERGVTVMLHGPRKGKKYREEQYKLFFKFAIALGVMIVLTGIAYFVKGAG